jgi:hypothetical protein
LPSEKKGKEDETVGLGSGPTASYSTSSGRCKKEAGREPIKTRPGEKRGLPSMQPSMLFILLLFGLLKGRIAAEDITTDDEAGCEIDCHWYCYTW